MGFWGGSRDQIWVCTALTDLAWQGLNPKSFFEGLQISGPFAMPHKHTFEYLLVHMLRKRERPSYHTDCNCKLVFLKTFCPPTFV